MDEGVLFLGLFAAMIPVVAVAMRFRIPYAIALVAFGIAVGFIPGMPPIRMDPNLVLLVFLPPLLYWESIIAPTDVMLANVGQISFMAVGLVILTAVIVAAVAHSLIPNFPWPLAFILGAIVAPTDELASAQVLERFRVPRHLLAIVQGESLLNDASSLVLYAAAVAAAVYGTFSLGKAIAQFVFIAMGSLALGWIVGRIAVEAWRRIRNVQLQGAISFVLPFLAYEPAQALGLSGVLCVLTVGVYVNRFTPVVMTPTARVMTSGYWSTVVFIANAVLFLLVGLQLHDITTATFATYSWQQVLVYAVAVNAVAIAVRFAWVIGQEFLPVVGASSEHSKPDVKHAFIASWSGLRGAVSLAAALAIPTMASGMLSPSNRNLIIFLTFTVIVVTLIGGGLTLPYVIRAIKLSKTDEAGDELRLGIERMAAAGAERIGELEATGRVTAAQAAALRVRYGRGPQHADWQTEAEEEVLAAQRRALRERGEIDNAVLRQLASTLDRAQAENARDES